MRNDRQDLVQQFLPGAVTTMKTKLANDQLSRDLEFLQGHLSAIDRINKRLNALEGCVEQAARKLSSSDTVDPLSPRSDPAILEALVLERKANLANAEIALRTDELSKLKMDLYRDIDPVRARVAALLSPILERQLESVSASLRPFFPTDDAALKAAKETEACRESQAAFLLFNRMDGDWDRSDALARRLAKVIQEASTPDGDLLQFLGIPGTVRDTGKAAAK